MTWLSWRQQRNEALIAGAALLALVALLIISGRYMADTFQRLGVGPCVIDRPTPSCNAIVDTFQEQFSPYINGLIFLNVAPPLLAMLVGAPLAAREFERGTFRLVWTQNVTRLRWILTKQALTLGIAVLFAVALSALLSWWFIPLHAFGGYYFPLRFDLEGIVPVDYMAFAVSLAIAAGALLRRTIPAMVVTLAGFLAVRLPVEFWLRPRYLPPLRAVEDIAAVGSQVSSADWVLDRSWIDHMGHGVPLNSVLTACNLNGGPFLRCIHEHGWRIATTYQPATRFALFSGIETAITLGLAALLAAGAIWWVTRRIA